MLFLLGRNDEFIPVGLDIVIFRLLSDVNTVELKSSGYLLLTLEDYQRNLKKKKLELLSKMLVNEMKLYFYSIVPIIFVHYSYLA